MLVVGAGYTGLHAALRTVRAGRHTVVVDSEAAGWGCSTRNGGQIGTSVKPSFAELTKRHGRQTARHILRDGHGALAWLGEFIACENIDCDFATVGRFHAAHHPRQFEALARSVEAPPPEFRADAYVVPRAEQRAELGTDAYYGGVVYPRHAALHPARYHRGLLQRVEQAGAEVIGHCPATGINRDGDGVIVRTAHGDVRARDLIIATNGYTGTLTPWQRRRVIPIGSYVIATGPLPHELMQRLMPKGRVVSDTRKVVYYYRPSPDGRRIVFGGRVSHQEIDPSKSAPRLRAELVRLFPELADQPLSHSWMGFVAYTFDTLPHIGKHAGVYYAMGYCGSGVAMASYLGMRVGEKLLGSTAGSTGFDGVTFQTRPLYAGNPWFLAPSVAYYRWRDG